MCANTSCFLVIHWLWFLLKLPDRSILGAMHTNRESGLIEDSAHHFIYAAFQKPISGMAQIVDNVAETNFESATRLVEAPALAEMGSLKWHLEQVAGGIGGAVPFAVALAFTRPVARAITENSIRAAGSASAFGALEQFRLSNSLLAGFVQGAVFEPTSGDDFVDSRIRQGIVGSTTLGAMHQFSSRTASVLDRLAIPHSGFLRALVGSGIAGGGSGAVSTLVDSFLNDRKVDGKDVIASAYSMGFTAAALSLAGPPIGRRNSVTYPKVEQYVAQHYDGANICQHYQVWLSRQSLVGKTRYRLHEMIESMKGSVETKEVSPSKTLSELSPIQRLQLVERFSQLGQISILNERSLARFNDLLKEHTRNWDTDGIRQLEASSRAQAESLEMPLLHPTNELSAARNKRAEDLTRAVNQFLKEERLPAAKVEITDWIMHFDGSGGYGCGTIGLASDLMNSSRLTNAQSGILFHEIVHHYQDFLRLRKIADDIGIGITAKPEQIAQLMARSSTMYKSNPQLESLLLSEVKREVPPYYQSVLSQRNGQRLNSVEYAAARKIEREFSAQASGMFNTDSAVFAQHAKVKELSEALTNTQTAELLSEAMRIPQEFAHRYGFKSVPRDLIRIARKAGIKPELSIDKHTSPIVVSESTMAAVQNIFAVKAKQLENYLRLQDKKGYAAYMNSSLERQAYPAGMIAFLFANALEPGTKNP